MVDDARTRSPRAWRQQLLDHYRREVESRRLDRTYRSRLYAGKLDALPEAVRACTFGCGLPVDRAEIEPGERILDLGCGGAVDLILAARQAGPGSRLVGVDPSPEMVALARENLEHAGVEGCRILAGDAFSVPVEEGPFDLVLANAVLNLIPEKVPVLRRLLRLLRPEGRMMVADLVIRGRMPVLLASHILGSDGLLLFGAQPTLPELVAGFFEAGFEAVETLEVRPYDPRTTILAAARRDLGLGPTDERELERQLERVEFQAIILMARPHLHRELVTVRCCGISFDMEHLPSVHMANSPSLEQEARQERLNTATCPACSRRVPSPVPYLIVDDASKRLYHVFPESERTSTVLLESEIRRFHEAWEAGTGIAGYRSRLVFGPRELAAGLGPLL